jgi:ferric-dicitrate binding protein FerR (iron transport regulator)
LGAFFALSALAQAAPNRAASVVDVQPKATLSLSGTASARALRLGASLYPGSSIRTDAFGKAAFLMSDGSEVRLGANTELVLKQAPEGGKGSTVFGLVKGLFRAIVSPQGDRSFSVESTNGAAAVKGTEFQFEDSGKQAELKLLKGSVAVTDGQGGHPVTLKEGEAVVTFKDRVAAVRQMSKDEIEGLRQAFAERVSKDKKTYSDRVKQLKGN